MAKHTETRRAVPAQSLFCVKPNSDNTPKETRAPIGVEALNTAICFLQSGLGRPVVSSEVASANAVGAMQPSDESRIYSEWLGMLGNSPLCTMRAKNTTRDNPEGMAELFARADEPNARPSASAWITRPRVSG